MKPILVIPSIDIESGKTVRVVQGIPELNCPEYGNDPVEMAMIWRAENAKTIHVVDFNAAHDLSHTNFEIIREICSSVVIPVQYGGGIRNLDDAVKAMNLGVYRLVIGSLAFENPDEFKKIIETFGSSKIAAAIDVVRNEVVVRGRKRKTGISPIDYAKKLVDLGASRFIVTDVERNGMMLGPNIELSKTIAQVTGKHVTLSGGISGYKDLISVQDASEVGIDSVIIGMALYQNKFSCQKIWRIAESGIF